MRDLRALCAAAGLDDPRTHGASGNAVFESPLDEEGVGAALAPRLGAHLGRPEGLVLRTAAELRAVVEAAPFREADPSRAVVIFLDAPPPPDALDHVTGLAREEVRIGPREVHVHYPDGIGRSRLRIPAARDGTLRNLNTPRQVLELTGGAGA